MNRLYSFLFVSILLMVQSLAAQVLINGRNFVNHVACNHTDLGSIELNIKQTNPPYSYNWNTGQTTSRLNNLEPGEYIVKITDSKGADTTLHFKIIQVECEMTPEIFFTPNGDGYNDTWGIADALHFSNALVLVYNKLGQKVYEFNGKYLEQWDGTDLLGNPLPIGSYYFVVYSDKTNKSKFRKGTLSIIR